MATERKAEDLVLSLVEQEDWDQVAIAIAEWHPADIADLIERSDDDVHRRLFDLVPEEIKPDVLAELEREAETDLLESMTNSELSDIVEDMAPDDAADVLGDLPEERTETVLQLMEAEESEDVRKLLEYEEESAGGIMTTDVVVMREQQTVDEALQAIAYLDTSERFHYANIIDRANRLIGYIDVWELLRERNRSRKLGELAHRDFKAAVVTMDQEEVAHLMGRYDLAVIPVVDEAGVLVGRITADDVIDVIEEEASEDIFKMAGSDDAELEDSSVLKSCMVRLPWLFMTLFGSVVTSLILRHFHAYLSSLIVLAAFVPTVLAMGGNTGIQSSTLVVRSLALGTVRPGTLFSVLGREILTGGLMGLICGTIIGIVARFIAGHPGDLPFAAGYVGVVVGLALFSAMTFAALFGALVPLVLDRCRIDPAMASGPFVTITNDISALLIYFGVTILMLSQMG
ncbi:MAG: magnesium transporter [Kiritimatiellia bacterium]|jgi:magnesium transporter|nr:magnesium transporter [Kiritimatiellia bacterium]MDP6631395.1 magnesium transporter [Kiritimatiellia bacterium]MDP6809132.1 magnesium transporter [Kiritimatiellia bacterium]MDP7023176.1 magnesium transporter [Kiritimatiellia bacterium]